jgi:hypothetical protein
MFVHPQQQWPRSTCIRRPAACLHPFVRPGPGAAWIWAGRGVQALRLIAENDLTTRFLRHSAAWYCSRGFPARGRAIARRDVLCAGRCCIALPPSRPWLVTRFRVWPGAGRCSGASGRWPGAAVAGRASAARRRGGRVTEGNQQVSVADIAVVYGVAGVVPGAGERDVAGERVADGGGPGAGRGRPGRSPGCTRLQRPSLTVTPDREPAATQLAQTATQRGYSQVEGAGYAKLSGYSPQKGAGYPKMSRAHGAGDVWLHVDSPVRIRDLKAVAGTG